VSHPFFSTSFRRDPEQPRDLHARIDAQLAERLEEAVDFVCLDALVHARQSEGLAAPAADSEEDRAEFTASVEAFLGRLERDLLGPLPVEQQQRLRQRAGTDGSARAGLRVQVSLARELPDYWQRFDAVRAAYLAEYVATAGERRRAPGASDPSGGEWRRALGRLFGRR
jgi:hypothetical protein